MRLFVRRAHSYRIVFPLHAFKWPAVTGYSITVYYYVVNAELLVYGRESNSGLRWVCYQFSPYSPVPGYTALINNTFFERLSDTFFNIVPAMFCQGRTLKCNFFTLSAGKDNVFFIVARNKLLLSRFRWLSLTGWPSGRMGVNGLERPGARNGLQQLHGGSSPQLAAGGGDHYHKSGHHPSGGGGVVYGDGSWDLSVFVTDLQVGIFRI